MTIPLAEAARALGLAPSTLRHQIRLGRFLAVKLSRDWYTSRAEIERYRAESLRKREGVG